MTHAEIFVDIHVPKRAEPGPDSRHLDVGLSGYARPELAAALQAEGVGVTFSRGPSAYDHEAGVVNVLRPELERTGNDWTVHVTPDVTPIDSINAIRTTTRPLGHNLPELNHPDVRAVIRHPDLLQQVVDDAASSPVQRLAWAADQRPGQWLSLPLNAEFTSQSERLAAANLAGHAVVRTMVFGRNNSEPSQLAMTHIIRTADPGTRIQAEQFIAIQDVDTNPELQEIAAATANIHHSLTHHTGAQEIHFAVDWALRAVGDRKAYVPVGVFGAEPLMMPSRQNSDMASVQARYLAQQLVRVAENGGSLVE